MGRPSRSSTRWATVLLTSSPGRAELGLQFAVDQFQFRFKIDRGKFDEPFAGINVSPEFMASRLRNTFVGELDPRVDDLASPVGDAFGY